MTQTSTDLLTSLGLGNIPDDKKQALLQQLQEELEERVGEKLSAGMSEEQLAEFDALVENDEAANRWLQAHKPNYEQTDDFQAFLKELGVADAQSVPINMLSNYAVASWIEINHPNYQEVVGETIEEMREELAHNQDVILGK